MTNGVGKVVLQGREDRRHIRALARRERIRNWNRSRSRDGRDDGAEAEGDEGSDLHEGEHDEQRFEDELWGVADCDGADGAGG